MKNGKPYVFEINARCSGTTAARTLSGFNEPKMIADYLLKEIEPSYKIKEQTILRYWKELVVPNEKVSLLNEKGAIEQRNITQL
jgi:carbamoyl-phosphate synthase large subunit